jgi:rubrerythrin
MGSRPVNILLTPGTGMLILPQETTITTNFRISRSCAMMSTIPADLSKLSKENLNQELLRIGIIAELDAINLYEQLAALSDDADIKKVFLDIAKEEKTHVGEFQTMLLRLDEEQVREMEHGREEIEELTGK